MDKDYKRIEFNLGDIDWHMNGSQIQTDTMTGKFYVKLDDYEAEAQLSEEETGQLFSIFMKLKKIEKVL